MSHYKTPIMTKNQSKAFDDMVRKTEFFTCITKILSFYQCPESCKGHCCKREEIGIGHGDFLRLKQANPTVAETIKIHPDQQIQMYILEKPCQFLNNDKCSVHSVKPIPCAMYPFVFDEDKMGYVGLHPCPLGLIVAKDLQAILWGNNFLAMKMEGASNEEIDNASNWQKELYQDWVKKAELFFEQPTINPLLFPQHALKPISMVLIGRHSKQSKRR